MGVKYNIGDTYTIQKTNEKISIDCVGVQSKNPSEKDGRRRSEEGQAKEKKTLIGVGRLFEKTSLS